jgi:hypothetical protein
MNNPRTQAADEDVQSEEELQAAMLDAYYEDVSIEDHR